MPVDYARYAVDPWRGAREAEQANATRNQNLFAQRQADIQNQLSGRRMDLMEQQNQFSQNQAAQQIQQQQKDRSLKLMGMQAEVIGKALDSVKDEQSYQNFKQFLGQVGQSPLGDSQLIKWLSTQAPPNYDPKIVQQGKDILNSFRTQKQDTGFTLSPGQTRYDSSGREVASVGKQGKKIERAVDLGDKQRLYYTDGTTEDIPKGKTPGSQNASENLAQTLAIQVIDGRLDPNMISKRGGLQQNVFAKIEEISPGFNIIGANANARFATTPANLQSRALINGVEPLYDKLLQSGNDLGNSSVPGINRIVNFAREQAGDPKIVAFNNLRDDTIAETERILLGSGVLSDSKYQRALKNVNSAQSYPQLQAAVAQLRLVVKSRLEALDKKPYQNTNQKGGFETENYSKAPKSAVDYLKSHPELKDKFKEKYGYLPAGF